MRVLGVESYIAVPLYRRDGSVFGTLCALDTLPMPLDDELFEVFALLADLIAYELEAQEIRLQREHERRALEDIIAIAGHDLRQPLTALIGRAQLLRRRLSRGTPPLDLITDADALVDHSHRALALSDALFDLAQIEAKAVQVRQLPFDLVQMVNDAVMDSRIVAPRQTIQLDAPDALRVVGDEQRLLQVLRNLLDNAIKYSPDAYDPVVVSVSESNGDNATRFAQITVSDSGIGVAADELPRLFERTFRATSAQQQGIAGAGLGLYIARQIVEAHGGTISAHAATTGGLKVSIRLPVLTETGQ